MWVPQWDKDSGGIAYSSRLKYVDQDEDAAFSEHPEMSSSDMLHMFRDYMDSYDQLRLLMMATMLLT